jgi:hypothetical protein
VAAGIAILEAPGENLIQSRPGYDAQLTEARNGAG